MPDTKQTDKIPALIELTLWWREIDKKIKLTKTYLKFLMAVGEKESRF
jgi:hypothetical protein